MLSFKARQCSRTVDTLVEVHIDIENPEPDLFAGRYADQSVGKLTPPCLNL